ncbi:hypothetical protein HDIA_0144 [Hartmannibacter diazotrophicus]|uniref:Uncharacterized protein n=1 Tax=Hartmannibacter diazotrophicus TaxID=1482074 RepID=A0A2C9D2J0_9HYPH|nr:hypothetical protein HDIA_0144 [Hartmannibacter diazotrophicus]
MTMTNDQQRLLRLLARFVSAVGIVAVMVGVALEADF